MARRRRSNRGGNQPPRVPAQHSGPGASSSRTDGGPTTPNMADAPAQRHGQGQVVEALEQVGQQGAGGGAVGGGVPGGGAPTGQPPIPSGPFSDPFSSPSEHPGESPFTQPAGRQTPTDPRDAFRQSDQFLDMMTVGPALPILEALAMDPQSTVSMRNYVRSLRSQLPPEFDYGSVLSTIERAATDDNPLDLPDDLPNEPESLDSLEDVD